MEKTVKQTRGTVGERRSQTTNDVEIAYINALKAIDADKECEFEQAYQKALRELAEVIFDLDDENNDVEPKNNAD